MSGQDIEIRLGLYLDGELAPADAAALEAEIENDPELKERLERMRRTSRELLSFYNDSQIIHNQDEADKEVIVERIVRESTMQARRSAINRMSGKRPSMILIAAVGIALLSATFLLVRSWMTSGPDAGELVEKAQVSLSEGYFEADLDVPTLASLIRNAELISGEPIYNLKCRVRTGPGRLFHLRFTDAVEGDERVHVGYDGERAWFWRRGDEEVQTKSLEELRNDPQLGLMLALVMDSWDSARASLDEAIKVPDALEMVGKVQEQGEDALWKVRLGGARVSKKARYWFDEEGRLRRISAGLLQFDLKPDSQFGREDLKIEKILPGLPIR